MVSGNLVEFALGGLMDAQRFDGQFYLDYTPYANYAFGIYTGGAGLSLSQAPNGANTVAGFAHYNGRFARRSTRTCCSPMSRTSRMSAIAYKSGTELRLECQCKQTTYNSRGSS